MIEAPLKFIQVQRQIFLAHIVIGADDATFQQRPESFNASGVHDLPRT